VVKDLHIVDQCRCKTHSKQPSDQERVEESPKETKEEKGDETKTGTVYKVVPRPWHKTSKEQSSMPSSSSTDPPRKIDMKKPREVILKPSQFKPKGKSMPGQKTKPEEEDQSEAKRDWKVLLTPNDIDSEEG